MRKRTAREQIPEAARAVARTPGQHPLLALQRTAGNRAVNALIARRRGAPSLDEELMPEADVLGAQAAPAPQPADLGAMAHTQGQDIHFAPGLFNPDEELLGHEAWHVRQQRQGRVG
jgi:hypothetical protein